LAPWNEGEAGFGQTPPEAWFLLPLFGVFLGGRRQHLIGCSPSLTQFPFTAVFCAVDRVQGGI